MDFEFIIFLSDEIQSLIFTKCDFKSLLNLMSLNKSFSKICSYKSFIDNFWKYTLLSVMYDKPSNYSELHKLIRKNQTEQFEDFVLMCTEEIKSYDYDNFIESITGGQEYRVCIENIKQDPVFFELYFLYFKKLTQKTWLQMYSKASSVPDKIKSSGDYIGIFVLLINMFIKKSCDFPNVKKLQVIKNTHKRLVKCEYYNNNMKNVIDFYIETF